MKIVDAQRAKMKRQLIKDIVKFTKAKSSIVNNPVNQDQRD